MAWFPSDVPARDVNVTVVISNVSVEFTKLGRCKRAHHVACVSTVRCMILSWVKGMHTAWADPAPAEELAAHVAQCCARLGS